jgi:hypothetical protein
MEATLARESVKAVRLSKEHIDRATQAFLAVLTADRYASAILQMAK